MGNSHIPAGIGCVIKGPHVSAHLHDDYSAICTHDLNMTQRFGSKGWAVDGTASAVGTNDVTSQRELL